jgi:hypothetical protein
MDADNIDSPWQALLLLSPPLPMNIPRLESQQNSTETAVFCGDARNISNGDIKKTILRVASIVPNH